MEGLLRVENLCTGFASKIGNERVMIEAVTGVTFDINEGESVALVGESGSGKSVTALSIMRLLDVPPASIAADRIQFGDMNVLDLSDDDMRKVRGNEMSMVFQEPMTSLNPLFRVDDQIAEAVILHKGMPKDEALRYAVKMLDAVGIPDAAKRARDYPHQMSGGMRQRVMIAMALSCDPRLLIADEPTTALDVTIQAQILDLIADQQKQRNMALLLITHNLGVVAEVADRVMVMYAGQIVESAPVRTVFEHPWHPYTHGLLNAVPSVEDKSKELYVIHGTVPSPLFFSKACRFHPRCPYAQDRCATDAPPLVEVEKQHSVRCWYPLSDYRGEIRD
jgi:oligopeptide/dipeptide ABC transporter ATP-binding protein